MTRSLIATKTKGSAGVKGTLSKAFGSFTGWLGYEPKHFRDFSRASLLRQLQKRKVNCNEGYGERCRAAIQGNRSTRRVCSGRSEQGRQNSLSRYRARDLEQERF